MTDRRVQLQRAARRGFGRRRGGFTLFELVLAMGMVAILAVTLYASLRVAFKAKESADAAVEPTNTAELAMDFLRTDLQNALPVNGVICTAFTGTDGQNGTSDADDVTFFSTADATDRVDGNGDAKGVELCVLTPDGATEPCLVRRVTRNLLAQVVTANPDDEVLCRNVAGFNVRYYGGTDLGWMDSWDSTQENNTLPMAVEVTLTLKRNDGPMGSERLIKFVRVFTMACGTSETDSSGTDSTGTGTGT